MLGIFYLLSLALCCPNLPMADLFTLLYIVHVMLHRRPDMSCLLLRNGLPLEPCTLLLQLKSLFLFITGQNTVGRVLIA